MPTRGLRAYSTMMLGSKACSSGSDCIQLHFLTDALSKLIAGHTAICCKSVFCYWSFKQNVLVLALQVNFFLHCARATSVLAARQVKRREMGASLSHN